jgi:hypothetical protein
MAVLGDSAAEMIDFINKSGLGVIGRHAGIRKPAQKPKLAWIRRE